MTNSGPDLKRFGEIVRRRREELGLRQDQLPKGPSTTALTGIENGRVAATPVTLRKLDASLRWTSGSAKRALDGGEPTPLPEEAPVVRTHDPKPYDRVKGARHYMSHQWSLAEDLASALAVTSQPADVVRAVKRLVSIYGALVVDRVIAFDISVEDRDAVLGEFYRRRDAVVKQLEEVNVVEDDASAGAPDETERQSEEASAASAAQGYDGSSGSFSSAVFSAVADASQDEQDSTGLVDRPGAAGDAG